MMKNFLAYELAIQLYRRVETLEVKGPLRDQLIRASHSVVLNLAEGSAKPTRPDKIRFYATAFGSLREVQAGFDILRLKDPVTLDLADHVAACLYRLVYTRR